MERITIRAFRATDDPGRCASYSMEHSKVLEDLGVDMVVRPDRTWWNDPMTIVVVAEHSELGMIGGIRLHKARAGSVLPMQNALEPFTTKIVPKLAELSYQGTAELCGLWNAHRFAGRGVPFLLVQAAISVANQIDVTSIVTFIAEYVAPYAERTGFVRMNDLGDNGEFVYPVPSIRTWAMILPDVLTIHSAKGEDRQSLISLRMRPRQTRIEVPKRIAMEVTFDLVVNHAMMDDYHRVANDRQAFAA